MDYTDPPLVRLILYSEMLEFCITTNTMTEENRISDVFRFKTKTRWNRTTTLYEMTSFTVSLKSTFCPEIDIIDVLTVRTATVGAGRKEGVLFASKLHKKEVLRKELMTGNQFFAIAQSGKLHQKEAEILRGGCCNVSVPCSVTSTRHNQMR